MKKHLLLLIIFINSCLAYGQLPLKSSFYQENIKINRSSFQANYFSSKQASTEPQASWLNFSDALIEEFSTGKYWPMLLWPDSNVVVTSDNTIKYYDLHGFVSVLDPVSTFIKNYVEIKQNLQNADLWYDKYKRYDIDSVRFYFNYSNFNNSVDTLKVYIILPSSNAFIHTSFPNYPLTGEDMRVILVNYDNVKNKPSGSNIIEHTVLLTNQDTLALPNFKEFTLPLSVSIPADAQNKNNKIGIAFTFIPGHSYNTGDTLVDQSNMAVTIKNKLNLFRLLTYEENYTNDISGFPFSYYDKSLNQSGAATKSVRYNKNIDGWNGKYINTFAFENQFANEHAYIDWYIKPVGAIFTYDSMICVNRSISFSEGSNFNPDKWQWDFGDGNTSSVKDPIHTFTGPGNFTIQLKSWNSTDTFYYSKQVNVDWCSSIGLEDYAKLKIYPNPVNNVLHIEKGHSADVEISIKDINGLKIKDQVNWTASSKRISLDVSDLKSGIYLIELRSGKEITVKKFIKL